MPEPVFVPKVTEQITIDSIPQGGEPKTETADEKQYVIPQEIIDAFLRLGGCTKESNYRIYGFYRRANDIEDNISFIRSEYEEYPASDRRGFYTSA